MSPNGKCVADVSSSVWHSHVCGRTGKVQVDGKWFCGTHDPAKQVAKKQRWALESVVSNARWEVARVERAAVEALVREIPHNPHIAGLIAARQKLEDARLALATPRATTSEGSE